MSPYKNVSLLKKKTAMAYFFFWNKDTYLFLFLFVLKVLIMLCFSKPTP